MLSIWYRRWCHDGGADGSPVTKDCTIGLRSDRWTEGCCRARAASARRGPRAGHGALLRLHINSTQTGRVRPPSRREAQQPQRRSPRTLPSHTASMSTRPTRPSVLREVPQVLAAGTAAPVRRPVRTGVVVGPRRNRFWGGGALRLLRGRPTLLSSKADGLTVLFRVGEGAKVGRASRREHQRATIGLRDTPAGELRLGDAQYVTALVDHAAPEGLRYLIVRNETSRLQQELGGRRPGVICTLSECRLSNGARRRSMTSRCSTAVLEAVTPSLVQNPQPQCRFDAKAIAFATALYSDPTWCDSLDVLDLHVGDFGPQWSPKIADASERAIQACNGGRPMPEWVTEVGYPSTPVLQASPVHREELGERYQGGETGQARFLTGYVQSTCTGRQRDRHQSLDVHC